MASCEPIGNRRKLAGGPLLNRFHCRWWADIESTPGVMAYGTTREAAVAAVRALALGVAADCIDHGEEVPAPSASSLG
jgi:predicted RNase H-like HicB family nuclease